MKRHIRKPARSLSCAGKVAMSRERAEAVAADLLRSQGALMSAYRCAYGCVAPDGTPAYHVGHRTGGRAR